MTESQEEPEELTRFSSWHRLFRVTAWILRWRKHFEKSTPDLGPTLSPEELDQAHIVWIRRVQDGAFRPEIRAAASGRPVPSKSPLRRLSPRLDKQGLLRVGGRLKHVVINEDQRHSIILPHISHVTHLVVSAEHLRTLHGGIQLTLAALCRRY